MYDDDILFDVPPLPEFEEEPRLKEHDFEQDDAQAFPALSLDDLEAALAVISVLEMDIEDEDDELPLLLH